MCLLTSCSNYLLFREYLELVMTCVLGLGDEFNVWKIRIAKHTAQDFPSAFLSPDSSTYLNLASLKLQCKKPSH